MDRIVILGGGFAGLTLAHELEPLAKEGQVDVVLVDRNDRFMMGLTKQWVLVGRRSAAEGERAYASLQAKHVQFVHDDLVAIDLAARTVRTRSRRLPYDHLVVALGAELAPELVPGFVEGAYNLYDLPSVLRLRSALAHLDEGTVVVAVTATPFKCPPGPYEYALLIADILEGQGVGNRVQILITTPEPRPLPVANVAAGEAIKAMLAGRGIDARFGFKPKGIDAASRTIAYENGEHLEYAILAAVPPHRAPKVVRDAGLADASGFVPVELGTFRSSVPDIYAVGDVATMKLPNGNPHPKAGVFAEAQAHVVARNLAASIAGGEPATYPGRGVCFVDTGHGTAAAAEIDIFAEGGPHVRIETPSREGLEGKRQFEAERFRVWFGS